MNHLEISIDSYLIIISVGRQKWKKMESIVHVCYIYPKILGCLGALALALPSYTPRVTSNGPSPGIVTLGGCIPRGHLKAPSSWFSLIISPLTLGPPINALLRVNLGLLILFHWLIASVVADFQ